MPKPASSSPRGFASVVTARLVLRAMRPGDAAALAAYRNDPETARHQGWDLPFTDKAAAHFVEEQAASPWPVRGDWVQLAIEHDGAMIGDVAVRHSDDGLQATIGYTLAPSQRCHGYATEAVGAVVDLLFSEGVHRVSASLDPDNVASARVLDRLGFRYEGRAVSAADVRGEWLDDDQYALLADERAAWLARDLTPPDSVALVEIDWRNNRAVAAIATTHSQERFVATVDKSYGNALNPDVDDAGGLHVPWLRAIEADGELVGFVMIAEATDTNPHPYLWRFLIDRHHQGRGIGKQALVALVDRLRAEGHTRLVTSWVPGHGSPDGFYLGLGFVPTGNIEDGEIEGALELL
jgi:RimJ/RimL family protein N-acetyltransferase